MKNKTWIGVILCCLLVAICPLFVKAETKVLDSQEWQGGPLTWTVYDNGTLEITGKGEFKAKKGYPWASYAAEITNVVIGDGVTSIPNRAFQAMRNIKTVKLGNSVQSIGESAFNTCYSLEKINIPASVVTIGKDAFYQCYSLETVEFSKNGKLKEIGENAFRRSGITAFSDNQNLVSIGSRAFSECGALRFVKLPDSLETLGSYAFAECESLSWFYVGRVQNMGEYVLDKSRNLEYVELHTPAEYENVYDGFDYCKKLKCVALGGNWEVLDGFCKGCPELTTVVLPNSIKKIWGSSFTQCPKLTNINLPDSLEYIGNDVLSETAIKGVILPDSVTTVGSDAFYRCPELHYFVGGEKLESIGDYALSGCPKLETVHLGGTKKIGIGALANNHNLCNVIWSENLTVIRENGFENCKKLPFAILPATLTDVENGVLGGCTELKSIYFLGDAPTFGETRVLRDVDAIAYYPEANTTWTLEVKDVFAEGLEWRPLCQIHTAKKMTSFESACDKVGLSGGENCKECGIVITPQSIVEPKEHQYTQKTYTADCTVAGFTTYTCKNCGLSYNDKIISALKHKRGGWKSIANNQVECKCNACEQIWTRNDYFYVYLQSDPEYKKPTVTYTVPSRPSTSSSSSVQTEQPTTEPVTTPPTSGSITTVPPTTADGGQQQIDPLVEQDVKAIAIMLLAIAGISLATMGVLIYVKLTKKDEEE